jgi:hypothetical protein
MGSLSSVGIGVLVGSAGWSALWAAAVVLVGVTGSPGKVMFADWPTMTFDGGSFATSRTWPLGAPSWSVIVTSLQSLIAPNVCGEPAVTNARAVDDVVKLIVYGGPGAVSMQTVMTSEPPDVTGEPLLIVKEKVGLFGSGVAVAVGVIVHVGVIEGTSVGLVAVGVGVAVKWRMIAFFV